VRRVAVCEREPLAAAAGRAAAARVQREPAHAQPADPPLERVVEARLAAERRSR